MTEVRCSLGSPLNNAQIVRVASCSFEQFAKTLIGKVPETDDKASQGWVSGATFGPGEPGTEKFWAKGYRDSDNFLARYLLSFDYDHISPDDVEPILNTFRAYAHLAYTTHSHTPEAPRIRVWLPLSRPCGYDEFQAVSRMVASRYDIEKMARESHVPAQYMFRPAVKTGTKFEHWAELAGLPVDVDEVLGCYFNWTDRAEWPHRSDGDGVHTSTEGKVDPRDKPGIIGEFCRAFDIPTAIERFDLPYTPTATPGRYTYTHGSRPEGAILYDDGLKLHSHHDTDPARGQCNAFDLVRMHVHGWLDTAADADLPVTERASFKAMVSFALEQPEVRAERSAGDYENLDDTEPEWLAVPDGQVELDGRGAPTPGEIPKATSRCTDQANAQRLKRTYGDNIVSVAGQFYWWEGRFWRQDDGAVRRCAATLNKIVRGEAKSIERRLEEAFKDTPPEVLAAALREPGKFKGSTDAKQLGDLRALDELRKWAKQCENVSTQDAAFRLVRWLLTLEPNLLNSNPLLFNCANGTVDLTNGELRPHAPADYITMCAPTPYLPDAEAPRFLRFLSEIFSGDQTKVDFLQRWFGYCLTGSVAEQSLMIHVGAGGNGKGTLIDAITAAIGEYAGTAAPNLILAGERHPAAVADLFGRRMVTVSETDDTTTLAEGVVKQMTGGDRLKARFMHKDFFEFLPTHKLQIFTNLKPQIKGQDYGMWRRLLLVSYDVRHGRADEVTSGAADKVRDLTLGATLRAEAPGILRWLVDGARLWHEGGLKPPASVLAEVRKYQAEQDRMAQFIHERCAKATDARQPLGGTGGLFPSYVAWCRESGYNALGKGRFAQELVRVVPAAHRAEWSEGASGAGRRTVIGFTGIKLLEDDLD